MSGKSILLRLEKQRHRPESYRVAIVQLSFLF